MLGHKGEHFAVRGPLNIARPVQGWPVVVQAGSSEAGRQIAAETADAVFTAPPTLEAGKRFYADVKGRLDKLGRPREHLKILPGAFVVVGRFARRELARSARCSTLRPLRQRHSVTFDCARPRCVGLRSRWSIAEVPETNASKSARERVIEWARAEQLTIRQLAQRVGGYSGLEMVGTPATIADQMGTVARRRGIGRLQCDVSVSARGPRRFRRQGRSGVAAARYFSAGSIKAVRCASTWGCRGRRTVFFSAVKGR